MDIEGKKFTDDRGTLFTINGFNPMDSWVKRFYIVENHKAGTVRAWHGHKKEDKWVTVVRGAAVIGIVGIDDWDNPSKDVPVTRVVLSADSPKVIQIPCGCANGAMSLTDDTMIMYFSEEYLEDCKDDDYRFPARYWDIWEIEER